MEWAFWLAALGVAYAYAGYPAILWVLSRLRPASAVAKAPIQPDVSLVIVARNEEARIRAKLADCLSQDYPTDRLEILVVSDGSTDATESIVAAHSDRGVRLVVVPEARGKPNALNEAVARAGGEVLVLCDARQRLAPTAVRELVANLADPEVGAVSGELHIRPPDQPGASEGVGAYWRYEKVLRKLESRTGSVVGVTGAIYATRRELFPRLDPSTILDDVAVPMWIALTGKRVVFEPRAQAFDESPGSAEKEYRRKVRTLAGNFQLVALQPTLLNPWRNPLFLRFVSHKLARLAVPWCMLVTLLASGALAASGSAMYAAAFAAQLGFYGASALGLVAERWGVRHPLLSIPSGLLVLNVAAGAALFAFLFGTQKVTWKSSEP
jgi:biofilm PGA synthesis N-glycosyltransferase PgaC